MLKIKVGARVEGLARESWYGAGIMAALFSEFANADAVMTSGTDGQHNPGSKHYQGFATDWRTKHVGSDTRLAIFEAAKRVLEPLGFDVVWEGAVGATPATTGAHIHIEFDPKKGEVFVHETA